MSEKKELLIAVHRLNVGGVQKALLSALDALDYDRYRVTLYVRQDRCELIGQVNPNVSGIVVNKDPTRYYRRPRAVLPAMLLFLAKRFGSGGARWKTRLDRYISESRMRYEKKHYFSDGKQYDVAVSYIQGETAAFVARYVDAKRKVMFFHGSTDEAHELHEAVMPAYDKIVAVNAGCRDVLRALYPAVSERIGYIENYVDARSVRAQAEAFGIERETERTMLCSCGRFTPVKGFDLAVEAAARLRENGTDFLWYFVGDGPERGSLETRISGLKLENNIRITGLLENPYPYIAGCDIYVQPSREESYGLSVKEAQLLCRPVVTTATVGGKSLVKDGETGLIADFTPEDVAQKIGRLVRDTALCARLREALRQTDDTGSRAVFCNAWETLLQPEQEGGV